MAAPSVLCSCFLGRWRCGLHTFTGGLTSAVARLHLRCINPPRLPSALSSICCVQQAPRSSTWFPTKTVSRGRLVACKTEALQLLGIGLSPSTGLPRSPPLLRAQKLLHQCSGSWECVILPTAQVSPRQEPFYKAR